VYFLGHNHNYIFNKEFEKSFFLGEKVISYWIKKERWIPTFVGMTEGWGGNDMREEEEITPLFITRLPRTIFN